MTHATIPTNNSLFPSTHTLVGQEISELWLQELQLPKWSLHSLMYKCTFNFLQNLQKFVGMLPAWLPRAPM
jgi:hypothetical protein